MTFWIKATEGGLYFTLLMSLLLFGASFVEGYTLLETFTVILGASLLLQGALIKPLFSEKAIKLFFFILMGWVIFLCVQLVPLPLSLARFLSPRLIELYQTFGPMSLTAGTVPLSIAWENGLREVGMHLTYVTLFFVSYSLIQDKAGLKRLSFAVVLIALFVTLLGLFFLRLSPGKLYGVFSFEQSTPLTPFLNKNHFANFLVMTLPVTLGLLFLLGDRSSLSAHQSFKEKILWFSSKGATLFLIVTGVFVLELVGLLRTSSRGGLMGLAGGLGSFMALLLFTRRKSFITLVLLATLVAVVIFLVYQVHPLIYKLRLLGSVGQDYALAFRLSNWKDTVRIFLDFPWAGIGAGSFDELFPFYKTIPEKEIFTQLHFYYAENEFLQGLVELGIIGSSLLAAFGVALTIFFLNQWHRTTSKTVTWLSLGMACGCVGMLTHSLVDFPTHIPSNMALFAVLGGAMLRVGTLGMSDDLKIEGRNASPLISLFLMRTAFVSLILFLAVPFLWRQSFSERHYLKAAEFLNRVSQEREISPAPVLGAYEYLLKVRKWSGDEESRVAFAFGKVYAYLGLLRNGEARLSWFQQAEKAFERAISRAPFNAAYHYKLAWLYQEAGKIEKASPFLKNAMLLEPQNPFYRFKFGENQARLGNVEAARELFKETVAINVNYIEPVLRILADLPSGVEPVEFGVLLPEGENRALIQHRMVRFFELRQEQAKAEAIRYLIPEQIRS